MHLIGAADPYNLLYLNNNAADDDGITANVERPHLPYFDRIETGR